jgi:rSAM/selenodomain-associated transferase 2
MGSANETPQLSIIVPVLNEALGMPKMLARLQPCRHESCEIIVVDGGSNDNTVQLASGLADQIATSPSGRGSQMNSGAALARGQVLLFLHADTQLPPSAPALIRQAIERGSSWGRFDVRIEGTVSCLGLVAFMMNWRSRLSGIATGDQAIFVTREAFERIGGFPDIPLMEDIVLSSQLRALSPPACLSEKVITSGRRWEKHGVLRTILLMWQLRLRFFLGANPHDLAREYGYAPRNS